jgi:glycosyltransferase involved in cell wall biosynthesis
MSPLRVLVDPRVFLFGRCGIARYSSSLCSGLAARGFRLDVPLVMSGSDLYRGWFGYWDVDRVGRVRQLLFRAVRFGTKLAYGRALHAGNYDVLLMTHPGFGDGFLSGLGGRPFVMVVHDIMRPRAAFDGFHNPIGHAVDRLAYLARRAARIVCVSASTKHDLMALAGSRAEQISVVHPGLILDIDNQEAIAGALPPRFLLFVGSRAGHKNFRLFVEALAPLLERDAELGLVCAGTPLTRWEMDWIDSLGLGRRITTVAATDPELSFLYRRALCLVYPSLYEGFGLPVLEAMASGCPVVTARNSSLAEVAGDAALYVDPTDASSLCAAVARLIESREVRSDLAARGRLQARQFPLDRMIDGVAQCLAEAATRGRQLSVVSAQSPPNRQLKTDN